MRLVNLIDLILDLFFANDRLALVVAEAFQNALMISLHLFLLLLFLLQLEAHKFVLLLGHGPILYSLTLKRLGLLLQFLHNLLEFLNALTVDLIVFLLRLCLRQHL